MLKFIIYSSLIIVIYSIPIFVQMLLTGMSFNDAWSEVLKVTGGGITIFGDWLLLMVVQVLLFPVFACIIAFIRSILTCGKLYYNENLH